MSLSEFCYIINADCLSSIMSCFHFQIKPLDKSSPEVTRLVPLWKVELLSDGRYGIFLTSRELKAQDSDSREEELLLCIVRPPYFGYLENITTGQNNCVSTYTASGCWSLQIVQYNNNIQPLTSYKRNYFFNPNLPCQPALTESRYQIVILHWNI